MTDWTEKYRPTTKSEVRGNDEARDGLWEWARTWDDHREAVVLHGSPGVGKTSAAHALAADMGWETTELNASDQRTADVIERFAGRASKNATLAGAADTSGTGGRRGRQLVIMDEADNIHYQYDRGGKQAVTRLVKESNQPIVLIANEYYDMSRGLRNATRDIEFHDVSARSIVPVLRHICRQEEIEFDEEALRTIAEANSGDLRSAIKDLQATVKTADVEHLAVEDVVTGERDRTVGIFELLDGVLKEKSAQEALYMAYDADETPDDLVRWIEDKVSMVYAGEELARSYEFLANADRWLGRVRATQNYGYWRYVTDNVAAGVAASRDGTYGGWTRYGGPPFRSNKNATRDEVLRRIAESGGTSVATARRSILPFLSAMTHHCKPRDLTVAMTAWYDFDEPQVAFVTGSGESTKKVQSIVADARDRSESAIEAHSGGAFAAREGTDGGAGDGDGDAGTRTLGDVTGDADGASTDADAEAGDVGGGDDTSGGPEESEEMGTEESEETGTEAADDGQSGLSDFM